MIHQPFFVPSVMIAILSLPLIFAMIPRNRFYGFRTQKTLSDAMAWYKVNRFIGILFIISSALYMILAWLFPMSGTHDPRFGLWLIQLCGFAVPLIVSIVLVKQYSKRL
ncbi:MAG TPA: SdpI family protein [Bacteroidota bacterium]|jgi:uncharacterized membrane protein|nr:SdpI family protein [Bacteroidota bacterium]